MQGQAATYFDGINFANQFEDPAKSKIVGKVGYVVGVWGAREILADIAGWQREMTPVLERLARGERPIPEGASYEDFDGWNARHVAARRGLAVAGIRAEKLEASHREFVAAARAVPESGFGPDKTATRIVDLNGPHHYREHAAQIRTWRRAAGL